MKLGRLLLLLILVSPTGCSFVGYGVKNVISAPYDAIQEVCFRHRMRNIARTMWRDIACKDGQTHSTAYQRGFEDGFVDYVDRNGTGEPPAIPPPWLCRGLVHSDEGQTDIEDWYAGFRHGARVARESGLRERAVMPIGLPAKTPAEPLPAQVTVPNIEPKKEMPPADAKAPTPATEMPFAEVVMPPPVPAMEMPTAKVVMPPPAPPKEMPTAKATPLPAQKMPTAPPPPIPVLDVAPAPVAPPPVAPPPVVDVLERVPAMPLTLRSEVPLLPDPLPPPLR
jgi:hypothetical protein